MTSSEEHPQEQVQQEQTQEITPPPAPPRKSRLVPIIIGVVILLAIAAAIIFVLQNRPVEFPDNLADFAPAESMVFVSLDARPLLEDAEGFKPALEAWKESQAMADAAQSLTEELAAVEIDMKEDILSWMGPAAAVAILDLPDVGFGGFMPASASSTGLPMPAPKIKAPPNFLLILTTRNVGKAEKSLAKIVEKAGATLEEGAYEETKTMRAQGGQLPAELHYAVSGALVLVASNADQLHAGLDRWHKKTPGLSGAQTYTQVMDKLSHPQTERAMNFYFSIRVLKEILQGSFLGMMMGAGQAEALRYVDAVGGSMTLTPDSMEMETISWGEEQSDDPYRQAIADLPPVGKHAFEFMPQDCIVAFSAQSPAAYWKLFQETAEKQSQQMGAVPFDPIAEAKKWLKEQAGLDLDTDILGWMSGEMSFALFDAPMPPAAPGAQEMPFAMPSVEAALVVEGTDAATVEKRLKTIRDGINLAMKITGGAWQEGEAGGATFHSLPGPGDPEFISLGQMDNFAFLASGPDAVARIVAAASGEEALAKSPVYVSMQKMMPARPLYIFFAEPARVSKLLMGMPPSELLESLRAVIASQELLEDGVRSVAYVNLDLPGFIAAMDSTRELAGMFPGGGGMAGRPQGPARCLSNVQQISLAMTMFAADHDDRLPEADNWVAEIEPYLFDESALKCPQDKSDAKCSYGMNDELSGADMDDIQNPAKIVIIFETQYPGDSPHGIEGQVAGPPRHKKGNCYGFADGHVETQDTMPQFAPAK